MNRKLQTETLPIPVFLAKASAISERAARAMRPNGTEFDLANHNTGNVITLRNRIPVFKEADEVAAKTDERGKLDHARTVTIGRLNSEDPANEC
ncbi:MAG: hypothetical protein K5905_11620 [Roseibium sp.]|uniref:hypothetical protein n=1 Tax=Roseibium sp. TaxID=1936156 RepID=UPI002639736F|nr:hypothetical protein [Roseibium sp.]MCV0426113.1 hypothetical protein [Roseibium sp.]